MSASKQTRTAARLLRRWQDSWPQLAHTVGWGAVAYFLGDTAIGGRPDGLLLTAAALLIAVQATKRRSGR